MISFVIPVYNSAKYIEHCVSSVSNQQAYSDIVTSIILIDDGSTDGSSEICNHLAEKDNRIVTLHQMNSGVSRARNAGIEHILLHQPATEYIVFLDSDDLLAPNCLTNALYSHITQTKLDIYAFGCITANHSLSRFSISQTYSPRIADGAHNGIWTITNHFAACMYHISLFRDHNIRFFEGYKYSEDKYFRLQCSFFARQIELLPQLMYIYRDNPAGAMSKIYNISSSEYFLPIIDGWLKSDDFINAQLSADIKPIDAGFVLSNVYLLDMAADHCMRGGSLKSIMKIISSHPHYPNFLQMQPMGKNDKNYRNKVLLLKHPLLFSFKYHLCGLIKIPLQKILRLPMLNRLYERAKYPLRQIPSRM